MASLTAEAPDPKTFEFWEDAFKYPIPAVRRMEQQLRSEIASNRERLRTLVGSALIIWILARMTETSIVQVTATFWEQRIQSSRWMTRCTMWRCVWATSLGNVTPGSLKSIPRMLQICNENLAWKVRSLILEQSCIY